MLSKSKTVICIFFLCFLVSSSVKSQSSFAISPEIGWSRIDGDIRHDKGRFYGLDLSYNYKLLSTGLWSYHSRNYGQNLNPSDFQGTYLDYTGLLFANYKSTSTSFGVQVGLGNSNFRKSILTGRMVFEINAGIGLSIYNSRSNYRDKNLLFYDVEAIENNIAAEIEIVSTVGHPPELGWDKMEMIRDLMDDSYETIFLDNEVLFAKRVNASIGYALWNRIVLKYKVGAVFHNNDFLDSLDWTKWQAARPDNDTIVYMSMGFSYIIDKRIRHSKTD